MNNSLFTEAYNRLNPEQRDAVDTIEGPVMVIAGPGTGKTQILTLRIANILQKTDVQPENILALTFTKSGVRAMKERLAQYIGAPAYRVHIHTFHEFAGELIRTYPDAYERAVGGKPISELEKISLIESILETPTLKLLRPSGNVQFYVKPILSALSLMKQEYITESKFLEIIEAQQMILDETPKIHEKGAHKGKVRSEYIEREKSVNKNRELLFVYRAYESALATQKQFDFDDMIFETVHALEQNEDMLLTLQEQYQYLLADEHQDVNGSQNKILELLASYHERPNIFVVGDEKQSIYRFQGASLENFLFFGEKFPHTKTIALTSNYRSVQDVLDIAHELITVHTGPSADLRIPLSAHRTEDASISKSVWSHEAVEHEYIVDSIKELISNGTPKEEIALIFRTNREVEDCATYLRKNDIEAEASADGDILQHPITTSVRTLIGAVTNPYTERYLFEVLQSGYMGVSAQDLVRILSSRSYSRSLASIIDDADFLLSLGISERERFTRITQMLLSARERMDVDAPHRVLEYILQESGFLEYTIASNPTEGGRVIRRLYDEVEEMVRQNNTATLRDVETMFTTHIEHSIPLDAPYICSQKHSVKVMTAHKAKGLEFLHVFIPHLTDGKWGGKTHPSYFKIPITLQLNPDDFDREDDERKLLYVAITRAKRGLYLSHSETNSEGRVQSGTRLLEGIGTNIITNIAVDAFEQKFEAVHALQLAHTPVAIDSALLTEVLRDRGLSATALNNYLRDPWNYFYRNVLRIPEIQPESAQFGTVLHDTLRNVMRYRREHHALPSTTLLKEYIERELGKLSVTANEYVRHHERALVALTNYLAHVESTLPYETKEEYTIQVSLKTGIAELPEILLTGQLDRLDYNEQGELIRVIDYKSGKPKTRGYIEGTTKESTGDYKRQLTFYALILSLTENELLKCNEGLLSFLEADDRGKVHEEAYSITEEEIEDLTQEIVRVTQEIVHGTFLNQPCDPDKSDYCQLVNEIRNRNT